MIQINRLRCCFLGFAFFYPVFLFAQTTMPDASANSLTAATTPAPIESSANTFSASVALEPVVVTANRLDTPAGDVSSSLTVLTAEDLEQKQSSTVLDALRQVPGLHVTQSGAPGENTAIYTRGGNDDSTLIMIDGVPLNNPIDASRSYDYLDQLSLDGVKQIEVVRGPQGALYGSAAMAGVVNIITRDGKGPLGGSALFEGGSYGTFQERVSAQGGDTGANFLLAASRLDTSGFPTADKSFGNSLDSPDDDTSGLLKVGASPVSNLGTDLTLRYSQSHTNLVDGGGANGDDPNYFADQKQLTLADQSKLTLGDWEQVLGISFVDENRVYSDKYDSVYPNSADQAGNYDGQMAQLSWQNNLKVASEETVMLGLQGYQEWGTAYYNSRTYSYTDAESANAEIGSLFAQSQTHIEDRFFLNVGGRVDSHSQFGTHGTFQVGAAYYVPGLETKWLANVGTGFEAPNLYQLYDPSYGNSGLQPETNTGVDVGFEQPLGGVRVGVTYFHDDYDNLFGSDSSTYQYINIARAMTQGIESFVEINGIQNLSWRVDYTYLNTKDLSTQSSDVDAGKALLRRPAHQGDMDASYNFGKLELGGTLSYVGVRLDENFNTSTLLTMPAYILVSLRGSYQLNDQIKLFARVDNLFNQAYEEVYGYGTAGLSAYGGIKISL